MNILIDGLSPKDFETITVSSTAKQLTTAKASIAKEAVITIETNSIRYRLDGAAPTNSVGHKADDGDVITLRGRGQIDNFQAIRITDDAALMVTYFV